MPSVLIPLTIQPGLPPRGSVVHQLSGRSMGTGWSARIAAPALAPNLGDALQRVLDEVVAQMSHWDSGSALSRFNHAEGGSWHPLAPDFFSVLAYALDVHQASGGAYDPCAGALVDAWGFGAEGRYNQAGFTPPSHAQIAAMQERRAGAAIELDRGGRRARQPGGLRLDLSSIAKGYAVDQMARLLQALGLQHHLVELGGELRGAGMKPDGQPWWVAVEALPDGGSGDAVRVALHGLALATSGDYRRYFQHGSVRAAHTLDPRSGAPVANGVASVSVLHHDCMSADAWSTALTVLGPDDGMALAEARQLAARFLVRDHAGVREASSSAWRAMLQ